MVMKFDKNIVPADTQKTLGKVNFLKELDARTLFIDGDNTGEIADRRAEFTSEVQASSFVVVFPPEVDLTSLSFFDEVKLQDVEFKAWSMIDEKSYSNYADSDVKVSAKGYSIDKKTLDTSAVIEKNSMTDKKPK